MFATRVIRLFWLIAGLSVFGSVAATSLPSPLRAGKPVDAVKTPSGDRPPFQGLSIMIVPGGAALVAAHGVLE